MCMNGLIRCNLQANGDATICSDEQEPSVWSLTRPPYTIDDGNVDDWPNVMIGIVGFMLVGLIAILCSTLHSRLRQAVIGQH